MSDDVVISVENLSKRYLVGHEGPQERYQSLRDTVVRHGKNFARKTLDMARGRQIVQGDEVEEFWALQDVSFEVEQGEVLGIIGRNGAGKSTLLKVLSRITEPTRGRVTLHGRVASLLEVGTGFHPELTGRENIFLNGAILGMTRAEIRSKFDEIVDFAGVENFLDTPVKRYSSGMYVRLAFAVAAHLEPEILIVDEVLAVGDAEFQKKCLGKMQDVAKGGRTVLFVSHNLNAVSSLCKNGLFLMGGRIKCTGEVAAVISEYKKSSENSPRISEGDKSKPRMVEILIDREAIKSHVLQLKVAFASPFVLQEPLAGIVLKDEIGNPVFAHNTWMDPNYSAVAASNGVLSLTTETLPLLPGDYQVSVFFGEGNDNYHIEENFESFQIFGQDLPRGIEKRYTGSLRISGRWKCEFEDDRPY